MAVRGNELAVWRLVPSSAILSAAATAPHGPAQPGVGAVLSTVLTYLRLTVLPVGFNAVRDMQCMPTAGMVEVLVKCKRRCRIEHCVVGAVHGTPERPRIVQQVGVAQRSLGVLHSHFDDRSGIFRRQAHMTTPSSRTACTKGVREYGTPRSSPWV